MKVSITLLTPWARLDIYCRCTLLPHQLNAQEILFVQRTSIWDKYCSCSYKIKSLIPIKTNIVFLIYQSAVDSILKMSLTSELSAKYEQKVKHTKALKV